jgi:hypothetical protein
MNVASPIPKEIYLFDNFYGFKRQSTCTAYQTGASAPKKKECWNQPQRGDRYHDLLSPLISIGHKQRCLDYMNDRFAPIVLKNSKIAGLRKSRKCSALAILAAARLCKIDTSASDRFCGN